MSTTNASGNSSSEATPEKAASTTSRSSRTKRVTKPEAGLVKSAYGNGAVIVLADNTRLVQTDSLPNHRPIALSDFEVVGTLAGAGHRPIAADSIQIANTDVLPGHRPIAVSDFPFSGEHLLPGNRPIAPNDVVDPPASVLMGYLD